MPASPNASWRKARDVIVNDLSLPAAETTARRLGGRAVAADVSDPASVAAMFGTVSEMTDRIDILVNNAGISGIEGDNDAQERIRLRAEAMARVKSRRKNSMAASSRSPTKNGAACSACTWTALSTAAAARCR